MPVAHREAGFRFVMDTSDHLPVHIHVFHGEEEAVFYLGLTMWATDDEGNDVLVVLEAPSLRENKSLRPANRRRALAIVGRQQQKLIEAWQEIHS